MNWSNRMRPFSNRQFPTLHALCVIMKSRGATITLSVRKKWQERAFFRLFNTVWGTPGDFFWEYFFNVNSHLFSVLRHTVQEFYNNALKQLKSRSNSLSKLVSFLTIYMVLQSKPSEMLPPWGSTVSWMWLVLLLDVFQWPICPLLV